MFKNRNINFLLTGASVVFIIVMFSGLIDLKDISSIAEKQEPMICHSTVGTHVIYEYDIKEDEELLITPNGWAYRLKECETYEDPRKKPG